MMILKVRFFGTLCIMMLLDVVCNILISYAAFLKLLMLEVSNTKGNQVSQYLGNRDLTLVAIN